MMKVLIAVVTCLSVGAPAYAASPRIAGSFDLAQVQSGTTGGPSGGPNQAQAVVKSGTTGGRSGGPNQSQFVKKAHTKKKTHH